MFCLGVLRHWKESNASGATYHRLARALQHPAVARVDVAFRYCSPQSVPAEIRGRGPEAERAFQKAMKIGKSTVSEKCYSKCNCVVCI